jgi:hypothetical protein|tara:strand:- start:572 stop:766 length:195 start_codon:yes stop_codon:yes gene_type:complete
METTTSTATATEPRQRMAVTAEKKYVPVQRTLIRHADQNNIKRSTFANILWEEALTARGIEIVG